MRKPQAIITRTPAELAEALGLNPADGLGLEIRRDLNEKIIKVVQAKGLTHAQVAVLAKTSRTRITAILNRNTLDISTDLMLRVLAALGVHAKLQFRNAA